MKTFKTIGVMAVLALSGMAPAATESLQVHVPFSFVVAGQEFAAGEYLVQKNDNGIIFVRGTGHGAFAPSVPSGMTKTGMPNSLVFRNNESREYLVGVQIEGAESRSIPLHLVAERKLTMSR